MAAYRFFARTARYCWTGSLSLHQYLSIRRYQASYLFSPADRQIYRLDRTTEQVTPLTP
jgi:hypothetical protein